MQQRISYRDRKSVCKTWGKTHLCTLRRHQIVLVWAAERVERDSSLGVRPPLCGRKIVGSLERNRHTSYSRQFLVEKFRRIKKRPKKEY